MMDSCLFEKDQLSLILLVTEFHHIFPAKKYNNFQQNRASLMEKH